MKFVCVPVDEAEDGLLAHNIFDSRGHKRLKKGTVLQHQHLLLLKELGHEHIYIARLEPGDVDENTAAREVSRLVCGAGVTLRKASTGRANLKAARDGVLRIRSQIIDRINEVDEGITIATLRHNTYVKARQLVATVKIIPFAVRGKALERVAELLEGQPPVVAVEPLRIRRIGLLVSSLNNDHDSILQHFLPALQSRFAAYNLTIGSKRFCRHTPEAVAEGVQQLIASGSELILIISMSAIIDRQDVIPVGVEQAGARVAHYGVPVDPGNLLMIAYKDRVAIVGVPGCARSRKKNAFDLVLPQLLAGDRLSKTELVHLGHGGLLDEIRERFQPREPDEDEDIE